MGGTFDPLHHGHLVAASEVAGRFDLQRVIFCPSGAPWHKTTPTTSGEDRYLMTVIGLLLVSRLLLVIGLRLFSGLINIRGAAADDRHGRG